MPISCPHPPGVQRVLFSARDYITGDRFAIEQCRQCGIAFTRPRVSAAELSKYYPTSYYGSGHKRFPGLVESLQRMLYSTRARKVEQMAGGPGKVLDVGCGPGFLLRQFRDRGWEAHGTEFSEAAAAHAREILKLEVSVGDIAEIGFNAGSFDAIVMWHALEHMVEPEATIAEVARLLRPGGIFLCAVPNFGSVEARLTRDRWFHLDVPRHLNHFRAETLARLLRIHGFAVERASYIAPEYDAFSFTQSVLNKLGLRHNLLYNMLRGARAKVIAGAPAPLWQKAASLVLAAPLGLLSLPTACLAALCGSGTTVTFYARKQRSG
jgi:SAM-dependent methyltransferase